MLNGRCKINLATILPTAWNVCNHGDKCAGFKSLDLLTITKCILHDTTSVHPPKFIYIVLEFLCMYRYNSGVFCLRKDGHCFYIFLFFSLMKRQGITEWNRMREKIKRKREDEKSEKIFRKKNEWKMKETLNIKRRKNEGKSKRYQNLKRHKKDDEK